jgi:hypothetical protein
LEGVVADSSGLSVTSDEPIAGLSEAVVRVPGGAPKDYVQVLAEAAAAQGVGVPAARGLPDVWNAVVDTILRRRVSKEIGPFEVPTPWMCFHVPPGGTGRLKIGNGKGSAFGIKLKAVGSGWGSGRSMTLAVSRDFQERTCCIRIALALNTRVTVYEGDLSPRADVLGVAGLSVEELAACPDCSGESERLGAMVVPAGEWIDLRHDSKGQTMETLLELADKSDLDLSVPFSVPGVDLQIGIEWCRRSQVSCMTTYVLPGGRCYRPSTAYGEPQDLPFWRWE